MKKIILITFVICFINALSYANDKKMEHDTNLFVDSYHYGLSGKDCSEVYTHFGTSKWTFNSNDPGDLDKIYEGCKAGKKDWEQGQKKFPQVLKKNKIKH